MLEQAKNVAYFAGYLMRGGFAIAYAEAIYKENAKTDLSPEEKRVLGATCLLYATGPYKRMRNSQETHALLLLGLNTIGQCHEHPSRESIDCIVQQAVKQGSPSIKEYLFPFRLKTKFD